MMSRFGFTWGGFAAVAGGLLLLAACSDPESSPRADSSPRFVTTIPPFEMILRPVVEGRATVERLLARARRSLGEELREFGEK